MVQKKKNISKSRHKLSKVLTLNGRNVRKLTKTFKIRQKKQPKTLNWNKNFGKSTVLIIYACDRESFSLSVICILDKLHTYSLLFYEIISWWKDEILKHEGQIATANTVQFHLPKLLRKWRAAPHQRLKLQEKRKA